MSLIELKKSMRILLENKEVLPFRRIHHEREILWIVPEVFGLNERGNIITRYNERRRYNFETFFLKPRLNACQEKEVLQYMSELLLFVELKHGTLRARDIMKCKNSEHRRELINRFGYDKFLSQMNGITIHRDGNSSLIRVDWHKDEEPLKLIRVKDSSTDRWYVIRVPPDMKTCRQALAWTFGLNESEYHPFKET